MYQNNIPIKLDLIDQNEQLHEVDPDLEVGEDWRVNLIFRNTALAGLPTRAVILLTADGWDEQKIVKTWPHGATTNLIESLLECGVRIEFSDKENQVLIQRIEPHWWKKLPPKIQKTFTRHGWDAAKISHKRPNALPKFLKQFAHQYGITVCEFNGFITTMQADPDWYFRLPVGLQKEWVSN